MAYTKKIYFKAIENYFNANEVIIPANAIQGEGELQNDITSEDIIKFALHEIELLNNKTSKKSQTKTQKENEIIKTQILSALADINKAVTISELQNINSTMAQYRNQKLSALLKQLGESGEVTKVTNKRKSYFSLKSE